MVCLTSEQAHASAVIHQLITAWATELDRNNGLGIAPLLTEDCAYMARGSPRQGREEAARFYRERLAELTRSPDGPPTLRHVISNLLIDFAGDDRASVDFLLVYFSSPNKPPVLDFRGVTALADCHMDCRRDTDGHWRIASFDSTQSFVRAPD
jgi:hypothetical protein